MTCFARKLFTHQAIQIALALSDEVRDLEAAGCKVIQVDEPALREGLPLKPIKKKGNASQKNRVYLHRKIPYTFSL